MQKHLYLLSLPLLLLATGADAQSRYGRDRRDYRDHRDYRYTPRYASGPRVSVIARLPHGAIQVVFGGSRYHYYGGRYYRPYDYGYCIVPPPRGIIIPAVPPGCVTVVIGNRRYYQYEDSYYLPVDRGYEVVDRPADAPVVTSVPATPLAPATLSVPATTSSYEKIVIDGRTYYRKDDTYYKAVVDDKGELFYEKVGQAGK